MKPIALVSLLALCLPLGTTMAQQKQFKGSMAGTAEVPAVSTAARGLFHARISDDGAAIHYQLSYTGLEGDVSMAHIHLGQRTANGGIAVWLCSNLGTPGVQPCPAPPASISGIITADDIVGPAAQGLVTGEFAELVKALRNGTAYANVHSSKFPGGEIRAQLTPGILP